jgi:hypothetical protein
MKKLLHIVLFSLCISLAGYAQELQKNYINYQGVASDASGDAITNTAISIQIALKFGSMTAAASYIENHSITTDATGVFSLQIGNGSLVSGTYTTSDWGTDASYITVSLNGTEVGTTEMVAVPFAMSSGDTQWTVVNGTDIENKNTGAVKVVTDLEVTGNISTQTGATINEFSTDGSLTDNSDTTLPTEKAVKTYVDNATSGAVTSINDLSDGKADTNGSSIFLGLDAGENDDGTDNRNVGVGYQALNSNTIGDGNVALGNSAGFFETGNNKLYIDNSNTNTPLIYGDFGTDKLTINGDLGLNTDQMIGSADFTIRSRGNFFGGMFVDVPNPNGDAKPFYGYAIDGQAKAYHYFDAVDDNWKLTFSNSFEDALIINEKGTTTIKSNAFGERAINGIKTHTGDSDAAGVYGENIVSDFYGIGVFGRSGWRGVYGTVSPTGSGSYVGVWGDVSGGTGVNYGVYGQARNGFTNYGVFAGGDLAYTGTLISTSDRKLKTNINKLSNGMATIMSLQPSTYSFKKSYQKSMMVSNKPQFGFMAQELQAVLPDLVSENTYPGATKEDPEIAYLGINYIGLIPVLTAGIQEQQEQINSLEAKLELQNQTIQSLTSRIEAIENR